MKWFGLLGLLVMSVVAASEQLPTHDWYCMFDHKEEIVKALAIGINSSNHSLNIIAAIGDDTKVYHYSNYEIVKQYDWVYLFSAPPDLKGRYDALHDEIDLMMPLRWKNTLRPDQCDY